MLSVNHVIVSLDVTLHNLLSRSQFFGGKFCLCLQAEVGGQHISLCTKLQSITPRKSSVFMAIPMRI